MQAITIKVFDTTCLGFPIVVVYHTRKQSRKKTETNLLSRERVLELFSQAHLGWHPSF